MPSKKPKPELPTYEQKRSQVFDDFETAITVQMARINTRLARFDERYRHINKTTRNNGPLIVEGGTVLAPRGDDVSVTTKK